jgi:hypothetical protein
MREPLKLVLFKTANTGVGSTFGVSVGMAEALGCGVGDSFSARGLSPLLVTSHATRTPATASTTTIPKIQGKALFDFDSRSEAEARGGVAA